MPRVESKRPVQATTPVPPAAAPPAAAPEPVPVPVPAPESGLPESDRAARVAEPSGESSQHAFHAPLPGALLSNAIAMKYANLAPATCRTLVQQKQLPVKRDGRPTPGVATALRFTGPLHGVKFLTAGWKSPFGVMDCRLVLVFGELAELVARHQVSEVHVGTVYRRNSKLRSRKLSQHAHGLAADIVAFKLEDGRLLSIEQDFSGQLGEPVCGPESRVLEQTQESIELRDLICDIAREGLFHYILTPNYDLAHRDHIHVDIKRGARHAVIR